MTVQQDVWLADLKETLSRRDLFEQAAYLETRIERADVWLDENLDADEVWSERFETLCDMHADVMDRIAMIADDHVELRILLPADYAGAVGHQWQELDSGELLAWLTRDELEAAGWVNTALCAIELDEMASAA